MTPTPSRDEMLARLAELRAANEATTSWGAAVGARSEEIRNLERRLAVSASDGVQKETPLTKQELPGADRSVSEYSTLHEANVARQREWDPDDRITLAYRGNELAGEIGEACNVIKKLERERLGINGSRDTVDHLMEELADGVICASLCAMQVGGNLDAAVEAKFNATSEKMGLKTRLRLKAVAETCRTESAESTPPAIFSDPTSQPPESGER